MSNRDFELAAAAGDIMDTTVGLAHATLAVLKSRTTGRDQRRVEAAKEIAQRFVILSGLQAFALDYSPTMPEAALRKWAADIVAELQR